MLTSGYSDVEGGCDLYFNYLEPFLAFVKNSINGANAKCSGVVIVKTQSDTFIVIIII